jgi:hypothetical protein
MGEGAAVEAALWESPPGDECVSFALFTLGRLFLPSSFSA